MATKNRKTPLPQDVEGILGTVRFARRERDLTSLREGDIALVELPELDARNAQQLVDRKVGAVLNASASSTGRVPNLGPQLLARTGVLLVDVEPDGSGDIWSALKSGERVRVHEGRIYRDEVLVASGVEVDEARAATDLEAAELALATRLDSLAANATDHIHREHALLVGGARVPQLRTSLRDRPVVVVSRTYDDAADLRGLKRYIRDANPVLIGAGAGADTILAAKRTPEIVIGALDQLSDRAIKAAGEVVVTTPSGTVDMPERLERHGKEVTTFVSTGSDEDLAILLADSNDAAVIIHAGAAPSLADLLERAPSDVARTFVSRLRAGSKVVDAKVVHQFTAKRSAYWPFILLMLFGAAAVAAAVAITPVGQDWYESLGDALADLGSWIEGLFT